MKTATKLTKTVIDNTQAPATGDLTIWDTVLQGFGIRVHSSGRKTYLVRYRAKDGKNTQRKMTLARCCDMPPEKARDMARKVFASVAEGQDPVAERKPATKEANNKTVGKMFEGYVATLRAKGKTSAREVERALLKASNNASDGLGRDRPAAEITPTDIVNYISPFYLKGSRGAANKHRGYIASAYAWAMKSANDYTVPVEKRTDWGLTFNPASVVAKDQGAVGTRDRNLTAEEIKLLWDATEFGKNGFMPETAAAIRLMLCCGQRVQETIRVEGSEVDLEKGLWKMPAHKTKGRKKPHTIPLPRQAVEILAYLREIHGNGLLFPSRYGEKTELMAHQSVMQAISRWIKETEAMPAFQTRDLRRTWKSRAHDAGVDRFTRDLIQQHAKNDTGSKNYDFAEYLPQMTEAMQKWEKYLDEILADSHSQVA